LHAKSVKKPILLDFTGYACVNCRKMEDFVWSDPAILKILQNEVVLISLYVDDKRIAKSEQYVSKETGKEIVSVGNKWVIFQITKFKTNAQPLLQYTR
jgi:thiol:disulfide interchange protein DsbD